MKCIKVDQNTQEIYALEQASWCIRASKHSTVLSLCFFFLIHAGLRANKSMMAWGVEVRVPFLDRKFMDYAMEIDPQHKMVDAKAGKFEKYILRCDYASCFLVELCVHVWTLDI